MEMVCDTVTTDLTCLISVAVAVPVLFLQQCNLFTRLKEQKHVHSSILKSFCNYYLKKHCFKLHCITQNLNAVTTWNFKKKHWDCASVSSLTSAIFCLKLCIKLCRIAFEWNYTFHCDYKEKQGQDDTDESRDIGESQLELKNVSFKQNKKYFSTK